MKKLIYALLCVCLLESCSTFVPIVKTYGYYPPTASAIIVKQVPNSAEHIGTISIHPNDHSFIRSWDREHLYTKLKEASAKAGARYIYITNLESSNIDYKFNQGFGDGYSIRAELYR